MDTSFCPKNMHKLLAILIVKLDTHIIYTQSVRKSTLPDLLCRWKQVTAL